MRCAVVSDGSADHLVFGWLAGHLEVLLGELPCGLYCFAAAGGEEHAVQIARGVGGKALSEFDRAGVGVGPDREERQFLGLFRRSGRQFLAAMTKLPHEQTGQAIEVLIALVVPDVGAFPLDDDGHVSAGVVHRVAREVHPQVLAGSFCHGVVTGLGDVLRCCCHRVPQVYICLRNFK